MTQLVPRWRAQKFDLVTREAILDATVATLEECGYAGTSVRAVARRAGVSQGALQHHFPTKTALVEAALLQLAVGLSEQARERMRALPDAGQQRCAEALDMLWEIHNLPIAHVITELLLAARTDADLREHIAARLPTRRAQQPHNRIRVAALHGTCAPTRRGRRPSRHCPATDARRCRMAFRLNSDQRMFSCSKEIPRSSVK
ncbi:TetR/AcrR family transcriptional regulator [Nocardia sp. NPDC058497]|uniref:TetR/AcrR family transcriptional regulator n=1 Tax=Nocardia sp. NPDC058497 TaxID=3346529 RepID=UPI0036620E52